MKNLVGSGLHDRSFHALHVFRLELDILAHGYGIYATMTLVAELGSV